MTLSSASILLGEEEGKDFVTAPKAHINSAYKGTEIYMAVALIRHNEEL